MASSHFSPVLPKAASDAVPSPRQIPPVSGSTDPVTKPMVLQELRDDLHNFLYNTFVPELKDVSMRVQMEAKLDFAKFFKEFRQRKSHGTPLSNLGKRQSNADQPAQHRNSNLSLVYHRRYSKKKTAATSTDPKKVPVSGPEKKTGLFFLKRATTVQVPEIPKQRKTLQRSSTEEVDKRVPHFTSSDPESDLAVVVGKHNDLGVSVPSSDLARCSLPSLASCEELWSPSQSLPVPVLPDTSCCSPTPDPPQRSAPGLEVLEDSRNPKKQASKKGSMASMASSVSSATHQSPGNHFDSEGSNNTIPTPGSIPFGRSSEQADKDACVDSDQQARNSMELESLACASEGGMSGFRRYESDYWGEDDFDDDNDSSSEEEQPGSMRKARINRNGSGLGTYQGSLQKRVFEMQFPGLAAIEKGVLLDVSHRFHKIQRLVQNRYFDWVFGMFLVINAISIGYSTNLRVKSEESATSENLVLLDLLLCIIFTLELGLRWLSYGRKLYSMRDWQWHTFDTVLVIFQISDEIAGRLLVDQAQDALAVDNFLQVLRLLRVVRLFRMVRLFPELSSMVYLIAGSMSYFLWTVVLLVLLMYCVAVFLTDTAHKTSLAQDEHQASMTRKYWGSVHTSMLSLFQATTGGDDWHNFIAVFEGHDSYGWHVIAFCVYVSFAALVMLNLVTGVFVEGAQKIIRQDKDVDLIKHVCKIFEDIDVDESMTISHGEFISHLDSGVMDAYFDAIELSKHQASDLFDILDVDGNDQVSIEEFVAGCMRLRGSARAIDIACFAQVSAENAICAEGYLEKILLELHKIARAVGAVEGRASRAPEGRLPSQSTASGKVLKSTQNVWSAASPASPAPPGRIPKAPVPPPMPEKSSPP